MCVTLTDHVVLLKSWGESELIINGNRNRHILLPSLIYYINSDLHAGSLYITNHLAHSAIYIYIAGMLAWKLGSPSLYRSIARQLNSLRLARIHLIIQILILGLGLCRQVGRNSGLSTNSTFTLHVLIRQLSFCFREKLLIGILRCRG